MSARDRIFPPLSHFVPNSRSTVAEVSPNWPKIAIPVPYCPILSHPVFSACFRSTYGQGLRPKTTSAPSLADAINEHIFLIRIQQRRRGWQGRRLTRQGNRVLFVSTQNWSNVGGYGSGSGSGSGSASFGSGCEGRRRFGFPLSRERRLIGPPAFKTRLPCAAKSWLSSPG